MSDQLDLTRSPYVATIERTLREKAPYLSGVLHKQFREFGNAWLTEFEADLQVCFSGNPSALTDATLGYIKFALDGMLLQKRFDKTGRYEPKTYAQAAAEVYQNRDYMLTLYLPGIYLSHYLWRHHYLQHIFFVERFCPLVVSHGGASFIDVGIGTGFYSKEMLRLISHVEGQGFDLSQFSLSYAQRTIDAFSLGQRYRCSLRDILRDPPSPAPFLINVEVLEHLEQPGHFLEGLYRLLQPGGFGFITAAITAPNADHIYLYNSAREVIAQITEAGFRVVDFREDVAYEPLTPAESVPKNAAIIVTK